MPRSTPRDPSFSTADLKPVIYNPDAPTQYDESNYRESLHQKEKRAKKMKPTEPVTGHGKGGRLGASATQSFVQTLFPTTFKHEDVSGCHSYCFSYTIAVAIDIVSTFNFTYNEACADDTAERSAAQVRGQEGRGGEVVRTQGRLGICPFVIAKCGAIIRGARVCIIAVHRKSYLITVRTVIRGLSLPGRQRLNRRKVLLGGSYHLSVIESDHLLLRRVDGEVGDARADAGSSAATQRAANVL